MIGGIYLILGLRRLANLPWLQSIEASEFQKIEQTFKNDYASKVQIIDQLVLYADWYTNFQSKGPNS